MTAPLLSWTTADGLSQVTNFDLGIVDAGSMSGEFEFLLWNNRRLVGVVNPAVGQEYGATDVSDVEDLTITTKDSTGGTASEVVLGKWLQVNAPDQDGANWFPVGYDAVMSTDVRHAVGSTGQTTYTYDGDVTPTVSEPNVGNHISTNGTVSLLGVANDGTIANSKGNFVRVKFRASVPGTAVAGIKQFLVRSSYKYV